MAPEIHGTYQNNEIRGKTYANMKSFQEKSVLGQDDFLKILITQLKNQDPLQPMQDREFIAQMATFSSLEQMTKMNSSIQEMRGMMLGQATSYVGKEISYEVNLYDHETGEMTGKEVYSGVVTGIENEKGKTYLLTTNGHRITLDALLSVVTNPSNPIAENAYLLGKVVTYGVKDADGNIEEKTGKITAVTYKEGRVQLILDNEDQIGLLDILKVENG
jgi:flagellar basal-body rod modification protein FlgD